MLHTNGVARAIALPLLRAVPFDISIRHHWVAGARIRLNVYRHKGYWFHGRNRERTSIALMRQLVAPGHCVFDVGAHIGYFTVIYADLVGAAGHVCAFEPGINNLPYSRRNLRGWPQVELVERAVADQTGTATLFTEDLTGQNNSLLSHYDIFESNARSALAASRTVPVEVQTVTLDDWVRESGRAPHFIKIDVEGAEYDVLRGARRLLQDARPLLMIEVSHDQHRTVSLLQECGYRLVSPEGAVLTASAVHGLQNIFAVPEARWSELSAQVDLWRPRRLIKQMRAG